MLTIFSLAVALALVPQDAPAKKAPIYDEAADARQQVEAATARAAADSKRVLIVWGANWCGSCKQLDKQMEQGGVPGANDASKKLWKTLFNEFEVVHLDVGRFDKNIDLVRKWRADVSGGIPALTVLNGEGKVVANQDNAAVSALTANDDVAPLVTWLESKQTKRVDAAAKLDAALGQAKESGRAVFVHFGAPWCGWCHKLDEWCADPKVQPVLAKAFVETKIDTERMTGGADVMNRYRADPTDGIPWFVVLDGEGKALGNSDAADGNIGMPAKPAEIDHAIALFKKTAPELTEEDLALLRETLAAHAK